MSNIELIKRLQLANVTCNECGEKYGTYSVGYSSWWTGICHVCGQAGIVTEARDFAYFITGLRRLKLEEVVRESP